MTPLTELSNVIQKQAIELEIKLPDNFEEIIAKIEPAGISSTDKAQFQNLLSVAQKDGYELLEKKFRKGGFLIKIL